MDQRPTIKKHGEEMMILVIVFTIPVPFLLGDNFQSHMSKRGRRKK